MLVVLLVDEINVGCSVSEGRDAICSNRAGRRAIGCSY